MEIVRNAIFMLSVAVMTIVAGRQTATATPLTAITLSDYLLLFLTRFARLSIAK